MGIIMVQPLPLAADRARWAYLERSELGQHGPCDLIYRVPAEEDAGPELPPDIAGALSLLLHEFDSQEGLASELDRFNEACRCDGRGPSGKAVLRRILPRLVTYRYLDHKGQREYVFDGHRPSSIHVVGRVLETDFRFRLEDLSHFATHGEHLLRVLDAIGLPNGLDPEGVIYCPALDAPYPFKFAVVGRYERPNREAYVALLKQLLRKTESDEAFRSRNFRELTRGFSKFGPASATPQFQEVELRIWRLFSYLAARLRVKAGRLTDTKDEAQVVQFQGELRQVHTALEDLVHLPGRLAAYYRSRFDLELSGLYEQALPVLDDVARRLDCDLDDRDKNIDRIAALVSEFRRLGSSSTLESLEEKDCEIMRAYGDVEVPELETGWARTYTDRIFTGADKFDERRYGDEDGDEETSTLSEEDLELDIEMSFGFGAGEEVEDEEEEEAEAGDSGEWEEAESGEWEEAEDPGDSGEWEEASDEEDQPAEGGRQWDSSEDVFDQAWGDD